MAGFYPDVPAPRMAYDRDGTVGVTVNGSSVSELSSATLLGLNDEGSGAAIDTPSSPSFTWYLGLMFPQLRDLGGFTFQGNGIGGAPTAQELSYSTDTTNFVDGTWTNSIAISNPGFSVTAMRTNIQTVSLSAVKAVRFRVTSGGNASSDQMRVYTLHIYGALSAGATPDRLRIWHPTLDEALDDNTAADGAYLDWGDVVRGTAQDRTFRIKNNSATLTANSIVLSPQVPTDTSPTVASQMTLSDGGAFTGSLDIGNLAPGATSSVLTLRRTIASNAVLSLWTGRINVNPGSWT